MTYWNVVAMVIVSSKRKYQVCEPLQWNSTKIETVNMLSRSMPWRRACPEVVKRKADEALQATIYILMQTGPTGFILKEEGASKKVKVFVGDPHMCSCTAFKKHHELCVHILWLLLKKFRIPQENPIIWQLGLVEREINELLHGYLKRQTPETATTTKSHGQAVIVKRKDIDLEDVCPICQDDLLGTTQVLTYCKFGCGNSVHIKCMKIWADHQKSTGEVTIRCPLCREDFGPLKEMPSESSRRLRAVKASVHLGVACTHCHVCPINGKCYKCTRCASYHLCHACFSSNQVHILHPFEYRQHCNQPWRLAERPTIPSVPPSDSPVLPPALVSSLQSRSLTENDYELLLQLEGNSSTSLHSDRSSPQRGRGNSESGRIPDSVINSFHVEPLHGNHPLITGHDECGVCGGVYSRGDWVRKLPCKHKFHRECIDEWLRSNHTCCPIDGQPVCNNRQQRKKNRLLSRRHQSHHGGTSRRRVIGPLTQAAMSAARCHTPSGRGEEEQAGIAVSGQGIGGSHRNSTSCIRERHSSSSDNSPLHLHVDSSNQLKPLQAYVLLRNSCIRQAKSISTPSTHSDDNSTRHQHTSNESSSTVLPKISNTSMCGNHHISRGSGNRGGFSTKRRLTVSIPTADGSTLCSTHETHPQSNATDMEHKDNDVSLAPVCSGYVPVISSGTSCHDHTHHLRGGTPDWSPTEGGVALPMVHFLYDMKTNDESQSPTSAGRLRKGSLASSGGKKNAITMESSNTVLNSSLRVSSFKLCPLPPTTSIVAATTSSF